MTTGLLQRVTASLDAVGVRYALIGAGALAVHGIARSTFDLDLFTTQTVALDSTTWATLVADERVQVSVQRGDMDDPLAGVIRVAIEGERTVDVVVGRSSWQAEAVERARPIVLAGVRLLVVVPADLILLKLYAGGSQDRWDIDQLLAGDARQALVDEVETRLDRLPSDCRLAWAEIVGHR